MGTTLVQQKEKLKKLKNTKEIYGRVEKKKTPAIPRYSPERYHHIMCNKTKKFANYDNRNYAQYMKTSNNKACNTIEHFSLDKEWQRIRKLMTCAEEER